MNQKYIYLSLEDYKKDNKTYPSESDFPSPQQMLQISFLQQHYQQNRTLEEQDIVFQLISNNKTYPISLRLIEWFLDVYCKNNIVMQYSSTDIDLNQNVSKIYQPELKQNTDLSVIYIQYKKVYQKRNFDPFKRYQKFPIVLGKYLVMTTIGQLQFIKFILDYRILEQININLSEYKQQKKEYTRIMEQERNELRKKQQQQKQYESESELSESMYIYL